MTTAELLALPENGTERWLVAGELRERPMTVRNRFHSRVMTRTGKFVDNWLDEQPPPHGLVLCGEAGVRLTRDPDTTVGIDVVYVSAEVVARQTDETRLIDGVPILAVEILSPNDTVEEIQEKLAIYRRARVPLVWIIDPYNRTVTVHRLDSEPQMFNVQEELAGDPQLPGFRVPVARLFE
jgi:Uma2 family endonuclease